MDFTIHTENIRITDDIQEFVQKKLSKLSRYLPNITSVHVEIEQQNSNRGPDVLIVQITLRHSRGAILRTEERIEKQDYNSMKTAISSASDKMYRRISRFKGKRRNKRGERFMLTPEELLLVEAMPDEAELESEDGVDVFEDETFEEAEVIRRKNVAISAMHEEEAIEQMELLGHTFFLFFNADTNSVNVVYKRGSGGYGVLEPRIE